VLRRQNTDGVGGCFVFPVDFLGRSTRVLSLSNSLSLEFSLYGAFCLTLYRTLPFFRMAAGWYCFVFGLVWFVFGYCFTVLKIKKRFFMGRQKNLGIFGGHSPRVVDFFSPSFLGGRGMFFVWPWMSLAVLYQV
jgi:hypothetical protein